MTFCAQNRKNVKKSYKVEYFGNHVVVIDGLIKLILFSNPFTEKKYEYLEAKVLLLFRKAVNFAKNSFI